MPANKKLLTGKVVVFTGTLTMPRKEATAMAERSGATVVTSVTSACNVAVIGANTGSKLQKAQAKGIDVWTEAEFIHRMTVEDHQERLGENKGRVIAQTGKSSYQFSLAWDALVDLDMHLETPKGRIYYGNRNVAGANLDVDRRPQMEDRQRNVWSVRPVENIVCDNADPGNYRAFVRYYSGAGTIPFTVHCRVGENENLFRGSVSQPVGFGAGFVPTKDVCVATFNIKPNGDVGEVTFGDAPAKKTTTKKPAAKKAAAKKPAAKKAAPKKVAKKAPAKAAKTTKKKAVAKKTTAKKPAPKKKAAAKKTAARKPAAKKAAPKKKAAAKKPAAKKATKKPAAKKAAPKKAAKKAPVKAAKTTKKKAVAKKTTAKKAAPKKKAAAKKTAARKPAAKKAAPRKPAAKKAPKKAPVKAAKTTKKKVVAKKAAPKKKAAAKRK